MKAILTLLLSLIFSSDIFSQSVFGEKLDYKFAGSHYSPSAKVVSEKDRIRIESRLHSIEEEKDKNIEENYLQNLNDINFSKLFGMIFKSLSGYN